VLVLAFLGHFSVRLPVREVSRGPAPLQVKSFGADCTPDVVAEENSIQYRVYCMQILFLVLKRTKTCMQYEENVIFDYVFIYKFACCEELIEMQ
jgi:hypothetical protein